MQPIAQISLAQEYLLLFNKISGARYHKVTNLGVKKLLGKFKCLAKPKSVIFKLPFFLISKFDNFKSLCIM